MKMISIDGGGVRGIIPVMILAEIESRTNKSIVDMCDIIAGTSIGGHIALGLTVPNESGKPRWSAQQLSEKYLSSLESIFPSSDFGLLDVIKGITHQKYEAAGIDSVLLEIFGDARLSTSLCEVLVTAYEVENAMPHFFTRHDARQDPKHDHLTRFVARATSAAPTYFEPAATLHSSDRLTFIDGGVFANNPTMCAFAHAQALGFDEDDMLILSLGTGAVSTPLEYETVKDWGLAHWARPVFEISAHASNHAIDWQLSHILKQNKYFRLTPSLAEGRTPLDDARPETMAKLVGLARELIKQNDAMLDQICTQLVS